MDNLIDQNSSTLHDITSNCKKVAVFGDAMQRKEVSVLRFPDLNLKTHHWCGGRRTKEYVQQNNPPRFAYFPIFYPLSFFHPFAVNSCCYQILKSHWLFFINLVWSFQFCRLFTLCLFSWSFDPFSTIAAHFVAPHFPLRPQGSFETRDWCLITTSRLFWGFGDVLERQKSLNLGRRGKKWEAVATFSCWS